MRDVEAGSGREARCDAMRVCVFEDNKDKNKSKRRRSVGRSEQFKNDQRTNKQMRETSYNTTALLHFAANFR